MRVKPLKSLHIEKINPDLDFYHFQGSLYIVVTMATILDFSLFQKEKNNNYCKGEIIFFSPSPSFLDKNQGCWVPAYVFWQLLLTHEKHTLCYCKGT